MIRHQTKAHDGTEKTTLGELLDNGGLERFTTHKLAYREPPCTDEDPRGASHPGDYATCLRCELLRCQDPREKLRRSSPVEIETVAQVKVRSLFDTIDWSKD